ncbi:MAG: CBS domain-containing protein [Chloroflexota bacterium]
MNDETLKRKLVRDLMSVGVATCPPATPLKAVAHLLLDKELEGVVVLDEQGHALGVVTQEELVEAYSQGEYQGLTAADVMQDGVPQVPPDIPLTTAAQIMRDRRVRVLFLMHHAGGIEYPAAVLTYHHLLRHLAAENNEELQDLGIRAAREGPLETFIKRRDEARRRVQEIERR